MKMSIVRHEAAPTVIYPPHYLRRIRRVSSAICLWEAATTYAFYGFLPGLAQDRHLTLVAVTLLAVIPSFGSFVMLGVAHLLLPRVGHMPIMVGTLLVWSMTSILFCVAPQFLVIFWCRSCAGCAMALDIAVTDLIAVTIAPQHRLFMQARLALIGWLGAGFGLTVATFAATAISWRFIGVMFAAPGLVLALFLIHLPEPQRVLDQVSVATLRERLVSLAVHPDLLLIMGARGMQAGSILSCLIFVPTLLRQDGTMARHLSTILIPLLLVALGSGAAGSIVFQRCLEHWTQRGSSILLAGFALVGAGVSLYGGFASTDVRWQILALCSTMVFLGVVTPLLFDIFAALVSAEVRPAAYAAQTVGIVVMSGVVPLGIAEVAIFTHSLATGILVLGILPLIVIGIIMVGWLDPSCHKADSSHP